MDVVNVVFASTWLVILGLVGGCTVVNPDLSDWMTSYDDSTLLSELNIPGTHDTLAFYGGFAVQCQTKSLGEQYRMGIRFVDIRCRRYRDSLPIHHGVKFQNQFFTKDAVRPTVEWLKAHPKETILMLVKQELHKPLKGQRSFSDMVEGSLRSAGAKYLTRLPRTLGEARGKIIIFHKDWPAGEPVLGTHLPSMDVNDEYREHSKSRKWKIVQRNLDRIRGIGKSNALRVTYASGYTNVMFVPNPKAMAKYVNPKLSAYCKKHRRETLGIILVDFPERNNIPASMVR